jgi:hypothetical protein
MPRGTGSCRSSQTLGAAKCIHPAHCQSCRRFARVQHRHSVSCRSQLASRPSAFGALGPVCRGQLPPLVGAVRPAAASARSARGRGQACLCERSASSIALFAKASAGCLSFGSQRKAVVFAGASFKRSVRQRTALSGMAGHSSSAWGGSFTGLVQRKLLVFGRRCHTHGHECNSWHPQQFVSGSRAGKVVIHGSAKLGA